MSAPSPWLTIVGIGEDGMAGLTPAARAAVAQAEIIVGGDRHHALAPDLKAERIAWPSPFDALIDTLKGYKGRRIVVLATGDPLWYSVGARIARAIPPGEIAFHPNLSAFQWAACRMGWSIADVETLTVHGRPVEQIVPFFWPGARLLVLTAGADSPGRIADLLTAHGYADSTLTVLASLGGPDERRIEGTAGDWTARTPEIPAFHTLAIACDGAPDPLLGRGPGLPDEAFIHDGKMTKREVRALTLARLMPSRGALLWDIGTGCGSVAIEWMRAARDARAIGIDQNPARLEMARRNAHALGAPRLDLRRGTAPQALAGLPEPDAVFIGGAVSEPVAEAALDALRPTGRLVVNAVTLESEGELLDLHAAHGGDLTRISLQRAEAIGTRTGWRPSMPIVQWSLVKR